MKTVTVLTKLHALRQELNTILLERENAVECALLALLTQQHLLLLGPPGTAKSLMVCLRGPGPHRDLGDVYSAPKLT